MSERRVDRGADLHANRRALEAELLEWMVEHPWRPDAARFERLALALFAIQYTTCAPYAAYCDSLARTPGSGVRRVEEIPAVPTGAFKEFDLRCFPEQETQLTFRTSGTSSDRRGALHLDTLSLYDASLLSSLRELFLGELCGAKVPMRFLAPSPHEAPDSSLSYMFAALRDAEGAAASGFDLRQGELDLDELMRSIAEARERQRPIVLAGTSFAFVHFLDATEQDEARTWLLPEGSRVMETGGFKGRSRDVPRDVLRAEIAARFGLDERRVINQYGMTELGSQFYDSTLVDPSGPRRKLSPPWARVRCVDPESGRDVAPGEVGLIVIHDLANTGSVAALQTADLGRAIEVAGGPPGFDVLGRAEGAEQRGCSIAVDVMLAAAGTGR